MTSSSPIIAAIALDLGNVLVRADHFRFCRPLAELAQLTPEEVYAAVFGSDLEPGYDTGRLSSQEFYHRLLTRFRLDLPYPQFSAMWNEIFDPMPEMEAVVEQLQARYPLYLLSNTNALHFHYIRERFPVLRHFRRFILSFEVGSRKPEPQIFQVLIRAAGHPPERILYVDDKPEFVAAAQHQGLVAWHFTSPQELKEHLRAEGLW
jgi:putative hydrolase of the HAD superfamily